MEQGNRNAENLLERGPLEGRHRGDNIKMNL